MSYLYKQYLRLITRWPRDKYKSDSRNLCYFLEREVERVFNQSAEPPNPALCERRLKVANTSLQSSALSPRWFSLATTSRMTGAPLGNGSNGSGSGGGGIQHEYPKDAADAVREVLKNAATSDVCVIESTAATQSHPKIKDILFPACVKLDVKVASALVSPSYIPHLLETIGRNELPLFFIRGNLVGGVNELQKLADRGTLEESVKKHDYDLVVIGGGSGGLAAAKEAAQLGKKVACLDFVKPTPIGTTWGLGGTCVNVGCIPKKLMHQAALLGEAIHDAKKFGWKIPEGQITHSWTKLVEGVQDHIGGLNWGYRVQLREKKVDYKNAYGVFTGSHEITATTKRGKAEKLTADKFLVAVGLRPRYPDVPGAKECTITSDDLFALPYNPGKTLCIGASYVSLECAGFLRGLGNEVSVLVRSILLRGFDQDMAERIRKVMIEKGVHFENGVPFKFERLAEPTSKAPGRVRVHYKRIGEDKKVEELTEEYDTIIVAIGRDAQTSDLGLEKVGVEVDSSGKVKGDLEQSKSVPHVYAIGDVLSGSPELTPVAIQAGRILMRRIFTGAPEFTEYDKIPTTVFTPLEYGCCGLSEDQAIERYGKDEVVVYHNVFEPLEYSVPDRMEKKHCYLKLVTLAKDERVLGFHILSPNAGEITQGFAIALKFEAKKADFDRLIGIHPTVAEQFTTLNIVKKENQELKSSGC